MADFKRHEVIGVQYREADSDEWELLCFDCAKRSARLLRGFPRNGQSPIRILTWRYFRHNLEDNIFFCDWCKIRIRISSEYKRELESRIEREKKEQDSVY